MIDPPTQSDGSEERRVELDQTVDYAVQIVLEEARSVGWTAVQFLTAVMDAADARLSALEGQTQLDEATTDDQA